jgi:hypothetical protein
MRNLWTVLRIMQLCVIFLSAMLLFFVIHCDSMKPQSTCTFGGVVFQKLLPSRSDDFQPSSLELRRDVDR